MIKIVKENVKHHISANFQSILKSEVSLESWQPCASRQTTTYHVILIFFDVELKAPSGQLKKNNAPLIFVLVSGLQTASSSLKQKKNEANRPINKLFTAFSILRQRVSKLWTTDINTKPTNSSKTTRPKVPKAQIFKNSYLSYFMAVLDKQGISRKLKTLALQST